MLTRLTHAAIAFAITVVVYQAYVLLAAPFIEPPAAVQASGKVLTAEERAAGREATHKYRELLAAYFPPGHWTLTHPPITAENGQTMIVIDEFNPRDDGQVRVKKCAILFFPRGRVRGEPPPSDAVVLEAPHGAVLQMDKSLSRGMGGLGRLQWGKLTGEITVRSDMREPGPQDDLLLTTRDLYMNEDLIRTDSLVEMQLGPHRGSGRELEIRLVAVERGRADAQGPNIGSIDTLEIVKDVQAQLSPGQVRLGPKTELTTPSAEAPPVKITCKDRFRFNFSSQVASFAERVQLTQIHPQGQLDELRCEELLIYFTNDNNSAADAPLTGKLSPGSIEAKGTTSLPVVLNAQSQQATARCERMWIELGPRRVTFEHGHEVTLTYEGNEIHAKQIQYEAPPKDSGERVGKLLAAGRGRLRAYTSGKGTADQSDAEPFEVFWSENMRLRRINGQPVLTLNGRPRLDMVGMGQLWADHLDLYLRESAPDGSEADLLPGDIVPDRLIAGGQIAIDAAQLHGQVKQLEVRFEYAPSNLLLTSPDGNNPRTGRAKLGQRGGGLKRAYDIVGETLQMLVTVRQKQPEVTSIDVDGQVEFSESPALETAGQSTATKQPLSVKADHLQIKNADSPTAEILLSGRPATPATIVADGMLIRTENLKINRGNSRAWVNVPGEIEMLVDRDLSGNKLATPQPMTIRWQRGMDLNQDRITFTGKVQVLTGDGTLDTEQLVVKLSAPVQFDGAASQRKIEVAQLECSGGVNAVFSQRDAMGLASVHTIKLDESFRINLQNGQLSGDGPGWLESVHLSNGENPLSEMASGGINRNNGRRRLASARPQQQAQRLRFLGVEFVRGVRGNLDRRHGRRVDVYGNVHAVYGPVDAWEQRLPLTKRGMPGPDTIWINSQSLGVAESPLARLNHSQQTGGLGPLELSAQGDVTIEGPVGERGNFTTHSREAKFDQLKKTFILDGDSQLPATLTYQEYRGAPQQNTKARKITYYQATGNIQINGSMGGQLRQLSPAR